MIDSAPEVSTLSDQTESARADAETADVALAASGDARAFERLYQTHVSRVHSLACRMLSPDQADETTQDVFVRAWEKLSTFRGEAAFGTWLHRLAINVMLGQRQSLGKTRARYEADDSALSTVSARPSDKDLAMDFEAAMGHLPAGAREVFVLHDVEGFKHEEIAGLLGIATGTSKAQLHRARMMLRRHRRELRQRGRTRYGRQRRPHGRNREWRPGARPGRVG